MADEELQNPPVTLETDDQIVPTPEPFALRPTPAPVTPLEAKKPAPPKPKPDVPKEFKREDVK